MNGEAAGGNESEYEDSKHVGIDSKPATQI